MRECFQLSPLQKIAGEFAETKLLNQLSLTHLGRWLKFHISQLEPHRQFAHPVLLQVTSVCFASAFPWFFFHSHLNMFVFRQLMRSVKHVVDKADWEPLVADLLQANVRGGLLHLARLAACAAAATLRRILKASIFEVRAALPSALLLLRDRRRPWFLKIVREKNRFLLSCSAIQTNNAKSIRCLRLMLCGLGSTPSTLWGIEFKPSLSVFKRAFRRGVGSGPRGVLQVTRSPKHEE